MVSDVNLRHYTEENDPFGVESTIATILGKAGAAGFDSPIRLTLG